MNAIVPLNIAALRVNVNDQTNIATKFKGATGVFSQLPWSGGNSSFSSTGDQILAPLDADQSPASALLAGVHLHWELPDFFRRGVQSPEIGADIIFPPAPNRFLVIRYLSRFDAQSGYGPPIAKCWVVESDHIGPAQLKDADGITRPAVSVPLPVDPKLDQQPYRFMGRVLNYEGWDPAGAAASDFLPSYKGEDGKPLCLTSIGFVGAAFPSYYPDCRSVFGFWDHFGDVPDLRDAIQKNHAVQFKVSYQIIGWLHDPADDPLVKVAADVRKEYDQLVAECRRQGVKVARTPVDVFTALFARKFRWSLRGTSVSFTLNGDDTLASLSVPERTLCAGITQEISWNMREHAGTTYFLATGDADSPAVFEDRVELALGNTTAEALSALLKSHIADAKSDERVLANYELLLNALQLGLLREIEQHPNQLIMLDEELHSHAFSRGTGGALWIVEETSLGSNGPPNPDSQVTLPPALAELLSQLNSAQKAYDQGRAGLLEARRQLFFDWFRYAKLNARQDSDRSHVSLNDLMEFLDANGPCELQAVRDRSARVGLLGYLQAEGGEITGLGPAHGNSTPPSLAHQVGQRFSALKNALPKGFQLRNVPAPPFWQPPDPVLLVEGKKLSPVHRNGSERELPVRVSTELLQTLSVRSAGATFSVAGAELAGLPVVSAKTPMQADIRALIEEAALLLPALAPRVAAALAKQPGAVSEAALLKSLRRAQGGGSQLEGEPEEGLFARVRTAPFVTEPNPTVSVTGDVACDFTFSNALATAWPPSPIAWTTQRTHPTLADQRADPFLPVWLLWEIKFRPVARDAHGEYCSTTLTSSFGLDTHAVDYRYRTSGWCGTEAISYDSSGVLARRPIFSLTAQIDDYLQKFPDDPAKDQLQKLSAAYKDRKISAQTLGGFNLEQTLRQYIPKLAVQNLSIDPEDDSITPELASAAGAADYDNWYDFGWNGQAPIATNLLAQNNFGPLRAGFIEVHSLEAVDAFGQRMALRTAGRTASGAQQLIAAASLRPEPDDRAHAEHAFLPPRLLVPSRLWFRWLSARHDNQTGTGEDFVETTSHPASSPVCGWVVPNHLENSLFFYDSEGRAVGSFGIANGALRYTTRAANLDNPKSDLAADIGARGKPTVNAHLASVMWSVQDRPAAFLQDLMATLLASDSFINPAHYAEDPALSVLVGRPLALARTVLGLESLGAVLPVNQADTSKSSPFAADLAAHRFDYDARVAASSAKLGEVLFPVRLGNLTNLDDGLIGFFLEGPASRRYDTFFASAAPENGTNGVARPAETELQLRLNRAPLVLTLLLDPRAPVHATTGILPVDSLSIPPDQYARPLRNLVMSFLTAPLLARQSGLAPPLPSESGFDWRWVAANGDTSPLRVTAASEDAAYGYSPQRLVEGWLQLVPAPPPPPEKQS